MTIYKKRNFGLDLIRSIAILLVLVAHAGPNNTTIYNFGFFGVELFFVLSGFLIGQILIKEFYKEKSIKTIKLFWIRRWFRILPMYFFVLIVMSIFLGRRFFLETFSFFTKF